jgi:hypothetical protein
MFDNLTDRLSRTLRNISGRGRLTEENVKETLREVRMALLEADVALPVVREFINRVKEKAVGHEVNKSLTPGQEFVKIVRNELVAANLFVTADHRIEFTLLGTLGQIDGKFFQSLTLVFGSLIVHAFTSTHLINRLSHVSGCRAGRFQQVGQRAT